MERGLGEVVTYGFVQAGTVASVTGTVAGVTPTCAATTLGNLLVIGYGSGISNLAITLPAGWQTGMISTNAKRARIYYYPNNPGGITSVAMTWTSIAGGSSTTNAQIMEFHDSAGPSASPLDMTGGSSGATSPNSIPTSSAVTASNELAVAAMAGTYSSATKDSILPGSGFTQAGQANGAVKALDHEAFDYMLDTGASLAVVTDTMTFTGPFFIGEAVIATFKVGVAAPAGILPQQLKKRMPAIFTRIVTPSRRGAYSR